MPRASPLILALAAGLIIVLSTINLLHPFPSSGSDHGLWLWSQQPRADDTATGGQAAQTEYLLGVGKADITGPVVELNLMGYANGSQLGTGLRQRLYSRAFIIGSIQNPADRFVYLVLDTQSGDTAIRHGILESLASLGDEYTLYGQQNVAVTGTHSHSGPAAWLNYLLPQITSKGFDKASYQAIVDGAVQSIKLAHSSLSPGHLSLGSIDIQDANINRSPYAYLANSESERGKYTDDVDKTLTLLRFTSATGKDRGILTWFAVHGTSMLGNNTIVTGDNKGVAAWMFERSMNEPDFVAGFSQANVGDTTPNVLGAYCESGPDEGKMCDFKTSLCGGKSQPCHGRGPFFGRDDAGTASNFEIGRRQFEGARNLFDNSNAFEPLDGTAVKSLHHFADLSNYQFPLANGTNVRTCPAALGYSFAAGTSDGPGAFDFKQGQPGHPNANPLWSVVDGLIAFPNATQKKCQAEKVILLDIGESHIPYDWAPNIVDIQLLRVGQLFIIVSPGEATTMSGRRWREAVQASAAEVLAEDLNATEPTVVLGGPANTYSHYIATREEYTVQRYEGASTLYGPHTLDAYINLTLTHLPELADSPPPNPHSNHGPQPPINTNRSLSFITGVVVDNPPLFKSFGDVLTQAKDSYRPGETVTAKFVGANPRNNFRLGSTFAAVERYDPNTRVWEQVRSDADWSLLYEWKRTNSVTGTSEVTISWETKWETGDWSGEVRLSPERPHGDLFVRDEGLAGTYRMKYYGDAKALGGKITAFEGTSHEFVIR